MDTKTKELEMDTQLAAALAQEINDKNLPVHGIMGLPFVSESGNKMCKVRIECPVDFDLDACICRVINKTFNLE